MRFLKILSALLLCFYSGAYSQNPAASVNSDFKKGEFITVVKMPVKASVEEVNKAIGKFTDEYNHNLNGLFGWALKGLELKGEKNDFLMFNLKSHSFNSTEKTVNGVMDINVAFISKDHRDIHYKTKLVKEKSGLSYEMMECEKVIDHVNASLSINRLDDNSSECNFEVHIKLQKPYSMMTMKQYRANLEWRFVKFMQNICAEAEKN